MVQETRGGVVGPEEQDLGGGFTTASPPATPATVEEVLAEIVALLRVIESEIIDLSAYVRVNDPNSATSPEERDG